MLREKRIKTIRLVDPADHLLEERLRTACLEAKIAIIMGPSRTSSPPWSLFVRSSTGHDTTRWPISMLRSGGGWASLSKRASPLAASGASTRRTGERSAAIIAAPPIRRRPATSTSREAAAYVNNQWPDNPGSTDGFIYPVTPKDARRWLREFLIERLDLFGDYEDGMRESEIFLFHSVLTPC